MVKVEISRRIVIDGKDAEALGRICEMVRAELKALRKESKDLDKRQFSGQVPRPSTSKFVSSKLGWRPDELDLVDSFLDQLVAKGILMDLTVGGLEDKEIG